MHKNKRRILKANDIFWTYKSQKTSKSDQVYRIRESPFSKGFARIYKSKLSNQKIPTMKSLDGVNKKNDVNNTASEAPEKM